jgi:hypothetical protein
LRRAAYEYLLLRVRFDSETGAAQHRRRARTVRNPPIGGVARIAVFDERQPGETRALEDGRFGERVIFFERLFARITALH